MRKPSPLLAYLFSFFFILTWWSLAFTEKKNSLPPSKEPITTKKIEITNLSPLSRDMIQKALMGDLNTLISLIQEWQIDADLLEMNGLEGVKKLPKEQYLQALSLGRHLLRFKEENKKSTKFLPQTFTAASILLALSSYEEIVALPKGIRPLTNLYPKTVTDQIPLNAEREFSEKLLFKKPDIAFVSNYSHPSTLEALENQGITLFTLPPLDTIDDIISTIGLLGEMTGHPLKGQLLQLFVEATFLAIDNRIKISDTKKVLFLTHMNHFSLPGKKTITGQLLTRLGIPFWGPKTLLMEKNNDWSIPLSIEEIANYHPDTLIISAFEKTTVQNSFTSENGFKHLTKNPVFVDDVVQTFPSQFIALAYYDLAKAFLESEEETF